MFKQPKRLAFTLPDWLEAFAQGYAATGDTAQRMAFVIKAARRNVEEKTGGPFAAAVFERDSGALVALGVNLVTTQGLSMLHAEMVAIAIAQKKIGSYDLGGQFVAIHELVTSSEPCAMCFGAIPWSGVRRVVIGARAEDARQAGFDEGQKPKDWAVALTARGITVIVDVQRDAAKAVFQLYQNAEGPIYNGRQYNLNAQ